MEPILILGIIVCVGFIFGGLASKLKLPKVTGYIIAGIILNPDLFHLFPKDFTVHTTPVTNIALAFIAFSIGGTLAYSNLKKLGKSIIFITIFESEFAFLAVGLGACAVIPFFLYPGGANWLTVFIPMSLLLASLAAPTDPSVTLAVVHQYKAKGPVTSSIIGVGALDDVLGIINFSLASVIANTLILSDTFNIGSFLIQPLIIIGGAIPLGIILGVIFNLLSPLVKEGSESVLIVMILGLLCIGFGLADFVGIDPLLAIMIMGIVVVNFNKHRDKVFKMLERYTEQLLFLLFFTLSGMQLNFNTLAHGIILVLVFLVFRSLGKVLGTMTGALISGAPKNVRKYTAGGLFPQGGLIVGLALIMKQKPSFDAFSDLIISIIIGSTIIHELLGPVMAKMSLKKAGEIRSG
jgi:Kef-type K+ transport system membrane component KefB